MMYNNTLYFNLFFTIQKTTTAIAISRATMTALTTPKTTGRVMSSSSSCWAGGEGGGGREVGRRGKRVR